MNGEGEGRPYVTTLADVSRHADPLLSSAACLSARFPIVSSAGWIPVTELPDKNHTSRARPLKRRFVDGGYFENSGLMTVDDALTALAVYRRERHPNCRDYIPWRPIVIRIGNDGAFNPEADVIRPRTATNEDKKEAIRESGGPLNSDSFEDYFSPILAFGNAWGARNKLGVNQMRARQTNAQGAGANARKNLAQLQFLQFIYFDEAGHDVLPLSWQLSAVSQRELFRQTGIENYEKRYTLVAPPAAPPPDSPVERNAETLSVISTILQKTTTWE